MSDIVIGTAGHIDHGKTTLIKALTGIETDRLKEEKLRGITIELGYAYLKTGENLIGIVDVPGHEKFIKNMVAGVTGIDVVLLIIAADEGVMPQTVEHIEICSLLGIEHGLIAVTKIDAVDKELLELIEEDIEEFKRGTFLETSPLFFVSSKTGEGLNALKEHILKLPEIFPKKGDDSYFIMPVDRVFTKKGFGTVVTGTTIAGKIAVGHDICVLPQNLEGKIRNIQVHGESVQEVVSGHRTAINIQGISKDEIKRGNILTVPETFTVSTLCDGYLTYLSSNKKPLKNRIQVKFYSGTTSVPAKVIILDDNELFPGKNSFVQFVFDREVFNIHGERFIIRSFDDKRTMGGGIVLDGSPEKKKRFKKDVIEYLQILLGKDLKAKVEILCREYGKTGITLNKIIKKININKDVLKKIIENSDFTIFDKRNFYFISPENLNKLMDKTLDIIEDFHNQNPKLPGIPLEELRLKIAEDLDFNLFEIIIKKLQNENLIKMSFGVISSSKFKIVLNEQDKTYKSKIVKILKESNFTPPFLNQLAKLSGIDEKELLKLLNILIAENRVVKIKPELFIDAEAYDNLKSRLIQFLKKNNEITIQEFKQIVNSSRKYLIPFLEHFDSVKLTIRKGDKRILRN